MQFYGNHKKTPNSPSMIPEFCFLTGTEGFLRSDWDEAVEKQFIGDTHPYVNWYECGVKVPGSGDKVVDYLSSRVLTTSVPDISTTRHQPAGTSIKPATTSESNPNSDSESSTHADKGRNTEYRAYLEVKLIYYTIR